MEFSLKLKTLMAERRLSQEAVARHLDVSQNLVSLWTRAKSTPDIRQGAKLARILGVSVDYLADDAQEEPPVSPSDLSEDDQALLAVFRALRLSGDEAIRRLAAPSSRPAYEVPDVGRRVAVPESMPEQAPKKRRSG